MTNEGSDFYHKVAIAQSARSRVSALGDYPAFTLQEKFMLDWLFQKGSTAVNHSLRRVSLGIKWKSL